MLVWNLIVLDATFLKFEVEYVE